MQSFDTELHGPNEKVGEYSATVLSDNAKDDDQNDIVNLKITLYKNEWAQKKEHGTIAIKYHAATKEYEPLLGAETNPLYSSVILMLDETKNSHWGNR